MAEAARVRLVFEDRHVLSKSQQQEGLRRCWLCLRPDLATVSDLAAHLARRFHLRRSCPHGLLLSIDGFVLPSFESTCIIKDKDVISVRKKGVALKELMDICDNANDIEDHGIVEKQPISMGDNLLAIKEFPEESCGAKSEDEDDDCDLLENTISWEVPLRESANSKRKREHSNELLGSKKKKQRRVSLEKATSCDEETNMDLERTGLHSHKSGSSRKKKKPSTQGIRLKTNAAPQIDDSDKTCSMNSEERDNLVEEKSQRDKCESPVNTSVKKFPSRSSRRKKAKRRWLRELANAQTHKETSDDEVHLEPHEKLDFNDKPEKIDQNREVEVIDQDKEPLEMDQNTSLDEEIVPVVVRPGHIRFEPIEEQDKQKLHGQVETLQWNGISSKKKGQKWGREKLSSRRNDDRCNGVSNRQAVAGDLKPVDGDINFEKLKPLTCQPQEGDVIAYRLVELSSSWCPELSPFRVGKVVSYDSATLKTCIIPVSGHPIFSGENKDEESMSQPDTSLYKEDGSLEIDFPTLVDVRLLELNKSEPVTDRVASSKSSDSSSADSSSTDDEIVTPSAEKQTDKPWEDTAWNEITKALEEKKAQFLKNSENNSSPKDKPQSGTWSTRALRGSALGPTIALLRARNDL